MREGRNMKVLLLRDARIRHAAGEMIDVDPATAGFLISTGSAELMKTAKPMISAEDGRPETEAPETPEKKTTRKTAKK